MESGKQGSTETTPSDENDREEQVKDDASGDAPKRSYECTFCRRGFTNAQALGGHMNIHRKDKAKARQVISIPPGKANTINPSYTPPISGEPACYYPVFEAQKNYNMYFQTSGANTGRPPEYSFHGHGHFLVGRRSRSLRRNSEEIWGENLSLRIGSSPADYNNKNEVVINKGVCKEDEVDLELRLGPDH